MTAWVHDVDGVDVDEPIEYDLTEATWAAMRDVSWTITEVALATGLQRSRLLEMARRGAVDAVEVGGVWLLDARSVLAWVHGDPTMPRTSTYRRRLDATPLLRLIDGRGGPYALGVRGSSGEEAAILHARRRGWVTEYTGDRLAVLLLGLTAWEVWPDSYT